MTDPIPTPSRLDPEELSKNTQLVRAIAVDAECDPRTVISFLRSKPTRSLVRSRIERALTQRQITLAVVEPVPARETA